jgi:hypothetical protein
MVTKNTDQPLNPLPSLILAVAVLAAQGGAFAQGAFAQNSPSDFTSQERRILEEDDQSVFTEKAYIRSLCLNDPKNPQCPKKRRNNRLPRDVREICKIDPFHPKCRAVKNKIMDEVFATDKFCASTTKEEQCKKRRRALKKMQEQID